MTSFISYTIELNIAIAIFYFVYKLLFKQDANFSLRRAFLLYAMAVSIIIPFFRFSFPGSTAVETLHIVTLDEIFTYAKGSGMNVNNVINIKNILFSAYLLVSGYFLMRLFLGMGMICKNILFSEKAILNSVNIWKSSHLHASSFFHYIFIDTNKADKQFLPHIIYHELQHARMMHSLDRILTELLIIIGWVNPFIWLMRKEVIINHEYQADNRVIEQGTDHVSYQLTILNQYIGSASITNQFSNHIKNRIIMLNKNYKKGSIAKSIALLPLSMLLLFIIACGNEDSIEQSLVGEEEVKDVFYEVENMPQWPGEDDFSLSLRKFIATNLTYPDEAVKNGVEGKVFVTFMVTKEGDVIIPDPDQIPPAKQEDAENNEVVVVAYKAISDDVEMPDERFINLLKEEGKRVVELIPSLTPGTQKGEPVNVVFTVPITFKLR